MFNSYHLSQQGGKVDDGGAQGVFQPLKRALAKVKDREAVGEGGELCRL